MITTFFCAGATLAVPIAKAGLSYRIPIPRESDLHRSHGVLIRTYLAIWHFSLLISHLASSWFRISLDVAVICSLLSASLQPTGLPGRLGHTREKGPGLFSSVVCDALVPSATCHPVLNCALHCIYSNYGNAPRGAA